ncbi:MAG: hypothetical protein RL216_2534 [Pseudomonadota bacterium]
MVPVVSDLPRWIALSDQPPPPGAPGSGPLPRGTMVFEIEMPLAGASVLLDMRRPHGVERADEVAISLFHDLGVGFALLFRRGERLVRHVLPGPLWQKQGVARLTFGWDGRTGGWTLLLEQEGRRLAAEGAGVIAPDMGDLHLLCAGGEEVLRHPSLLWFGVMAGPAGPGPMGWIGVATPVLTPRGPVAAGKLGPGDRVMTRDQGAVPLVSVTRLAVPGRGMLAPVRLRAPYYGRKTDILVSPDQAVWIGGAEAEYLFGEEEVLVRARHLADGAMAVAETARAAAVGVVLDLGLPELVEADGCLLATAGPEGVAPARRVLEAFEVLPLRQALGRTQRRAE